MSAPDFMSRREGRLSARTAGFLLLVYVVTRLGTLGALPIFLDESVHIQWAERLYEEGRVGRPVAAGRLLAVAAYGVSLFFEDRLAAARTVAAVAGALTLLLTASLASRLFGAAAGVAAGVLYLLSPFALTYDRLALSDGFLAACVAALMGASYSLAERPAARGPVVFAGLALALAITAKVSAFLFLLALPLVALLSPHPWRAIRGLAAAGALGILLSSPMLWTFATNGGEILAQHVVDAEALDTQRATTIRDMADWVPAYFSLSAVGAAIGSGILLRDRRAAWLSIFVLAPFGAFALFGQPWSARYVLPVLPAFLILIAGGLVEVARRAARSQAATPRLAVLLALALTLPQMRFWADLLIDPSEAAFPRDDRHQLVTGWPSGYGIRELAERLTLEARNAPVVVYVDTGGTRSVPAALAVLISNHRGLRIVEADLGDETERTRMLGELRGARVFAVVGPRSTPFDFRSSIPPGVTAVRMGLYQRPGGEWTASLFRLDPSPLAAVPDPAVP